MMVHANRLICWVWLSLNFQGVNLVDSFGLGWWMVDGERGMDAVDGIIGVE